MKLLDRYISREFAFGVLQGICWFGVMMIIAYIMPIVHQLMKRDLGFEAVLSISICRLPETFGPTFPMATLFGALIAIGRMSGDGEINAILSSGISFFRILIPVLLVGVVTSIASLASDQLLVPPFSEREQQLLHYYTKKVERHDGGITITEPRHGDPRRIIYIKRWKEKPLRLYGVRVVEYDINAGGKALVKESISADRAEKQRGRWVFWNAQHVIAGENLSSSHARAEKIIWPADKDIPDLNELRKPKGNHRQWSFKRLSDRLKELRDQNATVPEVNEIVVAMNNKIVFPVACILFAIIGTPLAIQQQRTSTSRGLGISFVVVLSYYMVWNISSSLGERGHLDPTLSSWVANLIAVVAGGILLIRAPK